jgi:indolepyruvate ferredoxin oxidoreductase alpha subunit
MTIKRLLLGNEAIARGAFEVGVLYASGYPGTPSTEILEALKKYDDVYVEWSTNEKVALENSIGAALGGGRAIAAMKHVGLNVAADPLMSASYIGVNAGLAIISADDPYAHSSQNEQDTRNYAKFAKIPMLEPSDSQECKDFIGEAMKISEDYDTPVLVRTTTRVSHSKSIVGLGKRNVPYKREFQRNLDKYVLLPKQARERHEFIENRLLELEKLSEVTPLNTTEVNSRELGIITSGISFKHAKEVYGEKASYLKLGMSYPLPKRKINDFVEKMEEVLIIEELDPFIEDQIGIVDKKIKGKEKIPKLGELNPDIIAGTKKYRDNLLARPPSICSGCSYHRVYSVLKKFRDTDGLVVMGDIGCYTLGALDPYQSIDVVLCMGASIGMSSGYERVNGPTKKPGRVKNSIAVIGDSTFIHSGITSLINAVYNRANLTVLILDNKTTAMTGFQDHPGTGVTLKGKKTISLDLENLVKSIGVDCRKVNPYNEEKLEKAIFESLNTEGVNVIISDAPCLQIKGGKKWGTN